MTPSYLFINQFNFNNPKILNFTKVCPRPSLTVRPYVPKWWVFIGKPAGGGVRGLGDGGWGEGGSVGGGWVPWDMRAAALFI